MYDIPDPYNTKTVTSDYPDDINLHLTTIKHFECKECMRIRLVKVRIARIRRDRWYYGLITEMWLHEVLSSSPWKTVPLSACQHVAH